MYNMQPQGNMSLQTPDEKQMGLFLHLSQLLNVIIPFGGIVAPIVLWQMNKDKMPALDAHGKMVTNWLISSFIYLLVSGILSLVIIGILGVIAVLIMGVVFPISAESKLITANFGNIL